MIKSYETVDDEIGIPIHIFYEFFDTMAEPLKVTELFFCTKLRRDRTENHHRAYKKYEFE